jgi:predicted membrane-bound spermidine synthase
MNYTRYFMRRKNESRFLGRLSCGLCLTYFFLPPLGFAGAAGLLAGLAAVLVEAVVVLVLVIS